MNLPCSPLSGCGAGERGERETPVYEPFYRGGASPHEMVESLETERTAECCIRVTILEATQGQISSPSPTDASSGR